jgi:hypothetical protein
MTMLFILGAPNAQGGALSSISLSRIDRAVTEQIDRPDLIILATGGFGAHFNTSKKAHREWVHDELLQRSARVDKAQPNDLLSSNTVEDVLMIARFAQSRAVASYEIVTSSFHEERCRFILDCLARDHCVTIRAATDPDDLSEALLQHETGALARLKIQKGVIVEGQLFGWRPWPSNS